MAMNYSLKFDEVLHILTKNNSPLLPGNSSRQCCPTRLERSRWLYGAILCPLAAASWMFDVGHFPCGVIAACLSISACSRTTNSPRAPDLRQSQDLMIQK